MYVLLTSRFSNGSHNPNPASALCFQWIDDTEDWETVTAERERWVRLAHHLEPLTMLYVVVGAEAMKTLPLIPYMEKSHDDEDSVRIADVVVHLLNDGGCGHIGLWLRDFFGALRMYLCSIVYCTLDNFRHVCHALVHTCMCVLCVVLCMCCVCTVCVVCVFLCVPANTVMYLCVLVRMSLLFPATCTCNKCLTRGL